MPCQKTGKPSVRDPHFYIRIPVPYDFCISVRFHSRYRKFNDLLTFRCRNPDSLFLPAIPESGRKFTLIDRPGQHRITGTSYAYSDSALSPCIRQNQKCMFINFHISDNFFISRKIRAAALYVCLSCQIALIRIYSSKRPQIMFQQKLLNPMYMLFLICLSHTDLIFQCISCNLPCRLPCKSAGIHNPG